MKKQFPGYFPQSNPEIERLWDTCLFIFDANILLNLYRYSDTTQDAFLRVLTSIQHRIWLPHRAAEEFFANRLSVIGQQEKAYDETIATIDTLRKGLVNARQHPFVSDSTMDGVQKVFSELEDELRSNQKVHTNRITDDSIQSSIAIAFAGRVGEPYDHERLNTIFEEGQKRYAESIPPGFMDKGKSDDSGAHSDKCRKYGDLLVWFQILDHALDSEVSVIFVTDDKKDDWWQTFKGKTIGPRPELVQEFLLKTKNSLHMYPADRFLELANQYLKQNTNEITLSEIRELRHRDREVAAIRRHEREAAGRRELDTLLAREDELRERLVYLNKKRDELMLSQHYFEESKHFDVSASDISEMNMLSSQIRVTNEQRDAIQRELTAVENSLPLPRRNMRVHGPFTEQELGMNADKPRRSD